METKRPTGDLGRPIGGERFIAYCDNGDKLVQDRDGAWTIENSNGYVTILTPEEGEDKQKETLSFNRELVDRHPEDGPEHDD